MAAVLDGSGATPSQAGACRPVSALACSQPLGEGDDPNGRRASGQTERDLQEQMHEYSSSFRKKETPLSGATRVNLEDATVSGVSRTRKDKLTSFLRGI